MKNIAIILGITDYAEPNTLLPACTNDVMVMERVCRTGGKFEEIVTIRSADAETVKSNLANLIDRFSQEDIDHLFFYFTGHGDYVDEDFRYQLRDYDKLRVAQTSISNAELDGMLHSLSPNVLIKVVDACYSGIPYIKDGTSISNYLADEIKGAFPRCYFFFSSQNDQKSYADQDVSDFTAAFAKAVATSKLETVRYKHVVDSISDTFSTRRKQIPQFVVQASFTEVLGDYSVTAKEAITKLIESQIIETEVEPAAQEADIPSELTRIEPIQPPTLAELARMSAQRYVSMEDVRKFISEIQAELSNSTLTNNLEELYNLEKSFSERYIDMPNISLIAKWLESNANAEYFAGPTFGTETYEAPRSSMHTFLGMAAQLGYEAQTVTKTRKVIKGITTDLAGLPFLTHTSTVSPRLPNLLQYKGWFTFIVSKTKIQLFYCFAEYREVSWGHFEYNTSTSWNRIEFQLTSPQGILYAAQNFFKGLIEWVEERTRARLAAIAGATE